VQQIAFRCVIAAVGAQPVGGLTVAKGGCCFAGGLTRSTEGRYVYTLGRSPWARAQSTGASVALYLSSDPQFIPQ